MINQGSDILIYKSDDGHSDISVRVENETVWLSIEQMADLFDKGRSTINEHILNVYKEKELIKEGVKMINQSFMEKLLDGVEEVNNER